MPSSNLARVFGPSIVGNSSPSLQPAEIINELKVQHSIVENLIKLPTSFYLSFVDCIDQQQQQRLFKNSAKTPELMRKSKTATVLSSILGPATNVQSTKYTTQIDMPKYAFAFSFFLLFQFLYLLQNNLNPTAATQNLCMLYKMNS